MSPINRRSLIQTGSGLAAVALGVPLVTGCGGDGGGGGGGSVVGCGGGGRSRNDIDAFAGNAVGWLSVEDPAEVETCVLRGAVGGAGPVGSFRAESPAPLTWVPSWA